MELRVFYGKIIADHSAVEMFLSPRKTFISANYFLIVLIISKSILICQKKKPERETNKAFSIKVVFFDHYIFYNHTSFNLVASNCEFHSWKRKRV